MQAVYTCKVVLLKRLKGTNVRYQTEWGRVKGINQTLSKWQNRDEWGIDVLIVGLQYTVRQEKTGFITKKRLGEF